MDKLMGSEISMTYGALVQMAQDRDLEMRDIARTEYFLAGNSRNLPAWTARVMAKLGDKLVIYGSWLKSRYSVQQAYRVN